MPKPFDATLKELVERYPHDWLAQAGVVTHAPVQVIDADVSTVTAGADRVIQVQADPPFIVHFELQSGYDATLPKRVLKYNVLVFDRHGLPVLSVIILLRREADFPGLDGHFGYQPLPGRGGTGIEYEVIRVWELPPDLFLLGGIGTLPLAPLAAASDAEVPAVIQRMDERIQQELPAPDAATLWTSTFVLLGLRYPAERAGELLKGIQQMRESSTYQAILQEGREEGREKGREEGRAEEARRLIVLLGSQRFGEPETAIQQRLSGIADVRRLERLVESLLKVESWDELLGSA
jgi:predicted transposase YdaD